jgi:hypothetical protein
LKDTLLQLLLASSKFLQAGCCQLLLTCLCVCLLLLKLLLLHLLVVLQYCCCQVLQESRVCMQREHC